MQGNLAKTVGADTYLIEECMGQALFDGNLKRKTFAKGKYYVVNQTELGGQPYNILQKYADLDSAKASFNKVEINNKKYSKILVEGSTGKIVDKEGDQINLGQNLIYMYKHVQGKVYDGRYSGEGANTTKE